ncbi:stage II sporulation protein M [Xanthomonas hyacinthi]|uniref:Stage II sporulation protein M n=1 Tax=Xanthomonas hyacinthi TaxID=56455 RepID=A0A2S7EWX0_9XANT|nr:stage II sporulation protein M [Xanthomonas hyacinthi]KLD79702.1 membrane protein [Xanthomonas hyacinthi DSM 19077]PPU97658.1 stage II sporulation protein M [Xanthomonas hyacinthi]QGY77157.1 stage II sporulation protein M [Xanthomonas hyacinthi]
MRQEQFIARHQHEWQAFETWLQTHGRKPAANAPDAAADPARLADEDMPARYRRLCQQLALARKRGYSPLVTARLQQLMQQGHTALYRPPRPRWRRAAAFLFADFPQLVRSQAGCMAAATALFVVPLVAIFVLLQYRPELIHGLMDPLQVAQMERMYDPAATAHKLGRDSGDDWQMFGHYIMHNISIGLRTFASGLLAGLGTVLVLLFNGVTIGAVAGHLHQIGYGVTFWRFVAGHAPFELTAIVIAGGAGLQLGLKLLAPGRRRRIDALVEGGIIGARLCLGVAAMLLVAAFIEAFWSSISALPAAVKYGVSGLLWTLVLVWLWRGGRGTAEAGDAD